MSNYSLFPSSDEDARREKLQDSFVSWVQHRAASSSRSRAERALNEKTATVYQEMWNAFAAYCAERGLGLHDVGVNDLEVFLATRGVRLEDAQARVLTKGEDLSARYARRFLSLIDKVTRFNASREGKAANTAAHEVLQRPEYRYADATDKDPLPDYLSEAQARRLIDYVTALRPNGNEDRQAGWKEVRDRTAVALMLGAGLAPGDVRALQVDGVINGGGRRSEIPWKLSLPGNGNSPARETPVAQWAGVQLAFWLSVRTQQGIPGDFVFPSTASGRGWSHTRCFEAGKAVLQGAGLGNESGGLFKLRHTFALRQLAKGRSEADVARWLGLLDLNGMARYQRVVMKPVEVV